MEKNKKRKSIQTLIFLLYILVSAISSAGLYFKFDISVESAKHATIFLLICIIILGVVTSLSKTNDFVHGNIAMVLSIAVIGLTVYYCKRCEYVHFDLLLCSIMLTFYSDSRLNKIYVLESMLVYIALIVLIINRKIYSTSGAVTYLFMGFIVVFSELAVCRVITKADTYKKVINENRKSSRDMLKVVEMKRVEAQHAAKAKTLFLSNMSHEIRTPINAILGMDEIIIRESNESNVIEYASQIQNAGNTLLSLINDILDFSKIESGKMEIIDEEYDLSELLNDIYNMISLRTEEKGLLLLANIASDIPSKLYGDPLRIKQVMINVLTNAVKYTEKGRIELIVDWKPSKAGYAELFITVSDTGIGIKEEDQDRLFESFERVESAGNKYIEGSGLGMSITRNLLKLMNGSITLKSEYGKGSSFMIKVEQKVIDYKGIGIFQPSAHISSDVRYKESFIAPTAELLIVDDNEMNLVVVKGLLKKTQIKIDTALSGKLCLEKVMKKHYDLILMDHMMPEMDGIETIHRLEELKDNMSAGVPVIALTANAIIGAKEMYLSNGFADYISKPIKGEKLEGLLLKYIPNEKITITTVENKNNEETFSGPINFKEGLEYAGNDEEQYMENITAFIKSADEKRMLMSGYIEKNDINGFTIEIHALKSNARYIGANKLSEFARELEIYGKELKGKLIVEKWDNFLSMWDDIIKILKSKNRLSDKSRPDTNGIMASDEQILSTMQSAKEALEKFELEKSQELLKQLLAYELSDEIRSRINAGLDEIDSFNYSKAIEILSIL